MRTHFFVMAIPAIAFTACSAYMAAPREGVNVEDVQQCRSRQQFVNLGSKIVSSQRSPDGNLVEIYQVSKANGSALRAIMHGLLDISTGFAWELIGTPIEIYLNHNDTYVVRVTYDLNDVPVKAEFV